MRRFIEQVDMIDRAQLPSLRTRASGTVVVFPRTAAVVDRGMSAR
ncbi:hypothetical protein [Natronococcus wangiae]|nr:hypothetical protein [Natronococcus sp. AD5]